ncbi:hypothetical protein GUJ93_ZPchr0011g26898 [Zizania palustris]|uniref:Uncharacterized protein n=1 Tax=Zizania palustris TaxID=103762 RepID=A0A8J6BSB1_ZIZPA|nr:hypothetical protein GUJ93_ZPchr0011g26898 [Zizania palustris]
MERELLLHPLSFRPPPPIYHLWQGPQGEEDGGRSSAEVFLTETRAALTELKEEHDNIKGMKGKNQPPEWSDYKSMPFSQCIINETLRVANIISLGSNRGRLNRTRNRTISGAGMDEGNPRCRCSGSPEAERVGSPRGG